MSGTEGGTDPPVAVKDKSAPTSEDEDDKTTIATSATLNQTKSGGEITLDDDTAQKTLAILQAQQKAVGNNIQAMQRTAQQALKTLSGDDLARKIGSCLNLTQRMEEKLQTVNQQIQNILGPEELGNEINDAFEFSMQVEDFKAELQQYQMRYFTKFPNSVAKPATMVISPKQYEPEDRYAKLPPLEMPTFSGDYTQWTSFLDQFDALIGLKKNLQENSKLFYLKSSLRGDAKALVSKIENNNAGNYKLARKILTDRYQNTRSIVKVHISNKSSTRQW